MLVLTSNKKKVRHPVLFVLLQLFFCCFFCVCVRTYCICTCMFVEIWQCWPFQCSVYLVLGKWNRYINNMPVYCCLIYCYYTTKYWINVSICFIGFFYKVKYYRKKLTDFYIYENSSNIQLIKILMHNSNKISSLIKVIIVFVS